MFFFCFWFCFVLFHSSSSFVDSHRLLRFRANIFHFNSFVTIFASYFFKHFRIHCKSFSKNKCFLHFQIYLEIFTVCCFVYSLRHMNKQAQIKASTTKVGLSFVFRIVLAARSYNNNNKNNNSNTENSQKP